MQLGSIIITELDDRMRKYLHGAYALITFKLLGYCTTVGCLQVFKRQHFEKQY